MPSRRKSRELAFKVLFQDDFQKSTIEDSDIKTYIINSPQFYGYTRAHLDFAIELIGGVQKHKEEIESLIEQNSLNWTLKRMSPVDLNLMKMATFEILYKPDIPNKVSFNEALELSKIFGDKDSPLFINGILDQIAKNTQ